MSFKMERKCLRLIVLMVATIKLNFLTSVILLLVLLVIGLFVILAETDEYEVNYFNTLALK